MAAGALFMERAALVDIGRALVDNFLADRRFGRTELARFADASATCKMCIGIFFNWRAAGVFAKIIEGVADQVRRHGPDRLETVVCGRCVRPGVPPRRRR
jgi:hypothetical protein